MEGRTAYRQPMTVFWSRAQHHVTTSLMKLAVGERNVRTNLGIIFRLCWRILFCTRTVVFVLQVRLLTSLCGFCMNVRGKDWKHYVNWLQTFRFRCCCEAPTLSDIPIIQTMSYLSKSLQPVYVLVCWRVECADSKKSRFVISSAF